MKKVALITDGWMRNFTYDWPSGFLKRIKELDEDVNLYIFNSNGNWSSDMAYNMGEYNIFNLPDYSLFDGIILDINNIEIVEVRERIIAKVKASGVPTIVIGNDIEDLYYVGIDNYKAFYQMIEHLYETHYSRSFWFIMGPEFNYENNRRLAAVKDFLAEHNIPEEDYQLYFGSFGHDCGMEGFRSLYQDCGKVPDAIVCANDNIAVGALIVAEEYGFKAPYSFLITGFDDFDKARYYEPRITTVSHVRQEVSAKCADLFLELWAGKPQERVHYTKVKHLYWESCSCINEDAESLDFSEYLKNQVRYQLETTSFQQEIFALGYEFMQCNSVREMFACIPKRMQMLKCDAMYMVIDPCIEFANIKTDQFFGDMEAEMLKTGYRDEMSLLFAYENGKTLDISDEGKHITDIFPTFETEAKGTDFLFLPLHFRENMVGYFVIRNAVYLMEKQFLFEIINSLTTAIENLYKKERLDRMNKSLADLYVRDSMTFLYNRFGLAKMARNRFSYMKKQKKNLTIIYIDMDKLKYTNDTFGHDMGDLAIMAIADAIKRNLTPEGMGFRLGGDEFLILEDELSREEADSLCSKLQQELNTYAITEKLPFDLSVSTGYVNTNYNEDKSFDDYINMADEIMYQVKQAKKGYQP